jgi:hypothetical protein
MEWISESECSRCAFLSVVTFRPARTSQNAGRVSEVCGGWARNGFGSHHLHHAQRFVNLIGGDRENSARVCTSLVLRRYGDHNLGQSDPHPEAA